ncbi:MAG TPA: aminotransferase class III-fold pyridoxal phosphate-dependent enzyme [Blastocatellia bacterium]|nr:aminotransferase class III-fold pyridoxal phosphate-dependent enzyme [Blastocatellia bacterium]
MNPYGHHCRPLLVQLLEGLGLDASYERSKGDYLWRREGEHLTRVLDLVGGYGVNLFGHLHPEIVTYAKHLLENDVTGFAQCSIHEGAGRLAQVLTDQVGPYAVVLTNSGTETIEAALKHAHLERGRSHFWAVQGAFHGKTLGAVQLTWSYHKPFTGLGPPVRFLNPDDPEDWRDAEKEAANVAAAFIEPIQGEGGIHPLGPPFTEWLSATCAEHSIPIVADEIQTGMGRTGTFLASEVLGIVPDYICLGKALGAGIAKIGALLIKRDRFLSEFSMIHSSTFAEDDWSCLIAAKALEIMTRDDLPRCCAEAGNYLLVELESLRKCFPDQIREVRGRGLIVGVELQKQATMASPTLHMISESGHLGYVAAAYLLNVHKIRVLPTLSDPMTLRVEPSAYIQREQLDHFVDGLRAYCQAVAASDFAHLIRHRVGLAANPLTNYSHIRRYKRDEPRTPRRVAFLGHLITPDDARACEPSFEQLSSSQLETFLDESGRLLEPTILHQENLCSALGTEVHLSFIALSLATKQFVKARADRDGAWIMSKIKSAAELAKEAGCQVLGLGGYTSIMTGNCLRLKVKGIALTSGNSLTVGMGVRALKSAAHRNGVDLRRSRMGVVGALGNIASTYALWMAPEVREVLLIVRDPKSVRVAHMKEQLRRAAPGTLLEVTSDLTALRHCSLIVSASNAGGGLIQPEQLGPAPVLICDIAVPADVSLRVRDCRPDVIVLQGGVVRLPLSDSFYIPGVPLEPGYVFACLAETLLMGLESVTSHGSYGEVTIEGVRNALALADKHGFALGALQTPFGTDSIIPQSAEGRLVR